MRALAALLLLVLATAVGASAPRTVPEQGRTVIVDGHRVAFRVVGSGRPGIVLISGLGDGMATFHDVAHELGKTHTVLMYDRAGYGGSERGNGPRDAIAAERELSGLLAQSGVTGPIVLLGHSLGGLFAEFYAAKHPDQVSGLILEDARPADFTYRCDLALGASKCRPPRWALWLMAKGGRDEASALDRTTAQIAESAPLRGKPVLVLSRASKPAANAPFDAFWSEAQANLAARYPDSLHLTAESAGHYIHLDERDWFFASVRAFLAD